MKHFIVHVTYRVSLDDDSLTLEFMGSVEAQRWQMFQKKYGIEPLELKIEKLSLIK